MRESTMKQYTFFSRDFFNNSGDFPISEEHYSSLLQHCFRYGKFLSLIVCRDNSPIVEELEQWRVPPFQTERLNQQDMRRFYVACAQVQKIISSYNLLDYDEMLRENYPEDLVFVRADGSIFFECIVHEGEYHFYPRDEENIADVLKFGHWMPMDEHGAPEVPASEHQLIPEPRKEIESEPFYLLLKNVQKEPYQFLSAPTITELTSFIKAYRPEGLQNLPPAIQSNVSFVPRWYHGLEMYILGKYHAMTNSTICGVLLEVEGGDAEGYRKFFEHMDYYVTNICPE